MNFSKALFNSDVQILKGDYPYLSSFTSPTHFFFLLEDEFCLLSDNQGNCWASRMEREGLKGYVMINPYFAPPKICEAVKTGKYIFKSFTEIYNMAVGFFSPFVIGEQKDISISEELKSSTFFLN